MTTPFDRANSSIPVTVVTQRDALAHTAASATRLSLDPPPHAHDAGTECVACAAQMDVRARLFDLLQQSRMDHHPLTEVVVDASRLANPQAVIDRIAVGVVPALGLRDHTVARSFHLSRVI